MSKRLILTKSILVDIANAIRRKTNSDEQIAIKDLDEAIDEIVGEASDEQVKEILQEDY